MDDAHKSSHEDWRFLQVGRRAGSTGSRLLWVIALLALISARAVAGGPASPTTYYIDFLSGSDSASGTSAKTAWKHAPGDPAALGNPKKALLSPGDEILFKAGVSYRGSIVLSASGAPGKPIVYRGTGWGEGHAIMTGLDTFTIEFVPYAPLPDVAVAPLPVEIDYSTIVKIDGVRNWLSTFPDLPADPYQIDANVVAIDFSQMAGTGKTWTLMDSALAGRLKTFAAESLSNMLVRIRGDNNTMYTLRVAGLDAPADTVRLEGDLRLPPSSREKSSYHLFNHPTFVKINTYAIERGRLVAAVKPGRHVVELSTRNKGIELNGMSYVTIDGFTFTGYSGNLTQYNKGMAIGTLNGATSHITITNNVMTDIASWAGTFSLLMRGSDFRAANNTIGPTYIGRGASAYKLVGLEFTRNHITNVGGTGLDVYNVKDGVITFNRLDHIVGTHSNGFAVYDNNDLANINVMVANNEIDGLINPITFAGNNYPEPPYANIVFTHNVITNSLAWYAVAGWGRNMNGITIEGNIVMVAEPKTRALFINPNTRNVVVRNNILDGMALKLPLPDSWTVTANTLTMTNGVPARAFPDDNPIDLELREAVVSALTAKGKLPRDVCDVLEPDGKQVTIGIDYFCAP